MLVAQSPGLLVSAEGTVEESVRDLINEKCIHFVTACHEVVGDPQEVFDDDGHLLKREHDRAIWTAVGHGRLPVRARRCGLDLLNVLHAERAHTRHYLNGCDTSGTNSSNEFAGAEARLPDRLTRSEHASRYDLSSRDRAASCPNHIWLTDVANKCADLT